MKKIRISTWAALCAAALLGGCTKGETDDPNGRQPQPATATVYITAAYGAEEDGTAPQTRANWIDHEGIRWENSDAQKLGILFKGESFGNAQSTSIAIGEGGKATFEADIAAGTEKMWTYYPYRPADNLSSAGDCTMHFNIDAVQTQAVAGQMGDAAGKVAFMGSAPLDFDAEASGYSASMRSMASIARFLIYSSEPAYRSESVKSVTLTSADGTKINGDRFCIGIWATGEQRGNNASNGTDRTTLTLDAYFPLSAAASAALTKGLYMGLFPQSLTGCTITVVTDAATYTFTSTQTKRFEENHIHNITLNLANPKAIREEIGTKQELIFAYGNPADTFNFDKTGSTPFLNGALATLTLDGEDVRGNVSAANLSLEADYQGAEAWLDKVGFENTGNFQWYITATRNMTDAQRTAKVYLIYEGIRSSNFITFKQDAGPCIEIVPTLTKLHEPTVSKDGQTIERAAMLALSVNGTPSTDVAADAAKYGVTLSCGTATATIADAAGTVRIVFPVNSSTSEKKYTLRATFESNTATAEFTQEPGDGGGSARQYTYTLAKNNGNPSGVFWGMPVNAQNGTDFTLREIKLDGQAVTLDAASAAEVMEQAFRSIAPTDAEKGAGYAHLASSDSEIAASIIYFNGSELGVGLKSGAQGHITKFVWYSDSGEELGYWMVFIP